MRNLFVDTGNLYYCVGKRFPDKKINYDAYFRFVEDTFGRIDRAIAYVSEINHKSGNFQAYLKDVGFEVVTKKPTKRKVLDKVIYTTSWLVEMTYQIVITDDPDPSTQIILGSSQIDFLPVLMKIPVHVVAAGIPKIFNKYASSVHELSSNWLI